MKKCRFALVNLNKPHDVAIASQLALAFEQVELLIVGTTLNPHHKKVVSKLRSWNIDQDSIKQISWKRIDSLLNLKDEGFDLIATSPLNGENLFTFSLKGNEVFVLGGAAGLSKQDIAICSKIITIQCNSEVPFLTVGTVVPLIIGKFI